MVMGAGQSNQQPIGGPPSESTSSVFSSSPLFPAVRDGASSSPADHNESTTTGDDAEDDGDNVEVDINNRTPDNDGNDDF